MSSSHAAGSSASVGGAGGGGGGGRLPPLGATALRQAVLVSAASHQTYTRRDQALLDRVSDILTLGPGLRRAAPAPDLAGANSAAPGAGSSGGVGTGSRRRQVTSLEMDPPSAFDDLRQPPRIVRGWVASGKSGRRDVESDVEARMEQQQQQQQQQRQARHLSDGGERGGAGANDGRLGAGGGANGDGGNNANNAGGDGDDDNAANVASGALSETQKALAATTRPTPYYLRRTNRAKAATVGTAAAEAEAMQRREIVIALGSDRMEGKELKRVIDHEYAVRMCEQLGVSPCAANIARVHEKLPLSQCSVTQVMHPGLARGERRNCISIVPKYIQEQQQRRLAALRGDDEGANMDGNGGGAASLGDGKRQVLDDAELAALLRSEEVSGAKRAAAATVAAHTQHMAPIPSATMLATGALAAAAAAAAQAANGGVAPSGASSMLPLSAGAGGGNAGDGSSGGGDGAGGGGGGGAAPYSAFEDMKRRFVFPFNEPVRNATRPESVFASARSARRNSPGAESSGTAATGGRAPVVVPVSASPNATQGVAPSSGTHRGSSGSAPRGVTDEHGRVRPGSAEPEAPNEGGGQDRTQARMAMLDRLMRARLQEDTERRRRGQPMTRARLQRSRSQHFRAGSGGAASDASGAMAAAAAAGRSAVDGPTGSSGGVDDADDDEDLQRLLKESDVVRLSEGHLRRAAAAAASGGGASATVAATVAPSRSSVDAVRGSNATRPGRDDDRVTPPERARASAGAATSSDGAQSPGLDPLPEMAVPGAAAAYQPLAVPPHVISECAGIPPTPSRADLDDIRRQFLRTVPIVDVFGGELAPLLKSAVLSEATMAALEATVEFFSDVCFLGPVRRNELLRERGRWLTGHVSSSASDERYVRMYTCCTRLLRDRAHTASVSRLVTRAAVLFMLLRVCTRNYFVRRVPMLATLVAAAELMSDLDAVFCAAVDPGCLYARVPQLESMPQALRVLHAKRAHRTGQRHALSPKAVSSRMQLVMGDSSTLRRFQAIGSRSFEPVVMARDGEGSRSSTAQAHHQHPPSTSEPHAERRASASVPGRPPISGDGGAVDPGARPEAYEADPPRDDDEVSTDSGGDGGGGHGLAAGDLLDRFLASRAVASDRDDKLRAGANGASAAAGSGSRSSAHTHPNIAWGMAVLQRLLSPNVKALLAQVRL
jgi:hypothetical protein